MDSVGEGEGGKIWENGMETCVISCMKKKRLQFAEYVLSGCFFVCVYVCVQMKQTWPKFFKFRAVLSHMKSRGWGGN